MKTTRRRWLIGALILALIPGALLAVGGPLRAAGAPATVFLQIEGMV